MIKNQPILVELDLDKSKEHTHPDIDNKHYYLAQIANTLYFGKFSKQWYGWNFDDGWGGAGHQFDAPGYNKSRWQRLWKIVDSKGVINAKE